MATPYVGEIRMFGGNYAPTGWEFCDGRLLEISENDVLFSLIGTTYGGDGQSTFAVPDLRGRLPVVQGTRPGGESYKMGQAGGSETVTLTMGQMPQHSHPMLGSTTAASQTYPAGHVLARSTSMQAFTERDPAVAMSAAMDTMSGAGQPHDNMQPYLPISFIIALFGLYPSQS